jgi:hypothetical protein
MPTWPASLPQRLEVSGYQDEGPDNTHRDPTDAGAPETRPRYSVAVRPVTGTILVTPDQDAIFVAFWTGDLAFGALKFSWVDPAFPAAGPATLQFREKFKRAFVGPMYRRLTLPMLVWPA